ncbi:response regulator transcription factor [Aerococcaceae bacterium NML171108]|nr:response regulator transcription factor [Aerococcaceae bacterium NML171108]
MPTGRILIVEDDIAIHQLLVDILKKHSDYHCESAYSGTEALMHLKQEHFDLILLDLMLPGLSGEMLLQQAKEFHIGGIIILSAKSDIEDKVQLLQLGADDYLTKPFHQLELLARIESVLRRYQRASQIVNEQANYVYRQLRIAPDEMMAYFNEIPLHLTTTEFEILTQLVQSPRKVFSREQLYQLVWGDSTYIEDNAINVHISNLRKKIAQHTDEPYIETVWGIGFKLKG